MDDDVDMTNLPEGDLPEEGPIGAFAGLSSELMSSLPAEAIDKMGEDVDADRFTAALREALDDETDEDDLEEEGEDQDEEGDDLSEDDVEAEDATDDEASETEPEAQSSDEDDSSDADTRPTPKSKAKTRKRKTKTDRQPPRSLDQKLKQGEKYIRESCRMPVEQFIQLWVGEPGNPMYRRHMNRLLKSLRREHLVSGRVMRSELKKLIRQKNNKFFSEYKPEESMDKVDLADMEAVIKDTAPNYYALQRYLLPHQRTTYEQAERISEGEPVADKRRRERMRKRIGTITQITTRSMALRKASWLPKSLVTFLYHGSVSRRIVDVLSNMGICSSYRTGQRLSTKNAAAQDERVAKLARHPQTFVVYDNLNQQTNRKGVQTIGDGTKQNNMTTSLLGYSPRMPAGGVKKSMLHLEKPLNAKSIVRNISNDPHRRALSLYHIDQALGHVFDKELQDKFKKFDKWPRGMPKGTASERFPWPTIDIIPTNERTEIYSLPVSMNDEVSISGTYEVLNDIFLKFLKLDDKKDFEERLWLIGGDQMTIERLLSVIFESVESARAYDKHDWYVACPGWFHILMNCLYTVLRTHWGTNSAREQLAHTLREDATFFNMKGISNTKPKFFLTMNLALRSWRSRIVALFEQELLDRGLLVYGSGSDSRIDSVKKAVQNLRPAKYLEIVEAIYDKAFTQEAWQGKKVDGDSEKVEDPAYTTMCRMLKEIENALTIKAATRKMDVGYLRRIVDYLIPAFYGAKQWNYGKLMVYMSWLFSKACDQELQNAILATSVVSTGKAGVAADEMLELHNKDYKEDFAHLANSTHDIAATFKVKSQNREAGRVARDMFEGSMGTQGTSYYTAKNTVNDTLAYADKLVAEGFSKPQPSSSAGASGGLSDNIQQIGSDAMMLAVKDLNVANLRRKKGITRGTDESAVGGVNLIDGADAADRVDGGDRGPSTAAVDDENDDMWFDEEGFAHLGAIDRVDLTGEPGTGGVGGAGVATGLTPGARGMAVEQSSDE